MNNVIWIGIAFVAAVVTFIASIAAMVNMRRAERNIERYLELRRSTRGRQTGVSDER